MGDVNNGLVALLHGNEYRIDGLTMVVYSSGPRAKPRPNLGGAYNYPLHKLHESAYNNSNVAQLSPWKKRKADSYPESGTSRIQYKLRFFPQNKIEASVARYKNSLSANRSDLAKRHNTIDYTLFARSAP